MGSERSDPTPEQVAELLTFLPWLRAAAEPFVVSANPWPVYSDTAGQLMQLMGQGVWMDPAYQPAQAGEMAADVAQIAAADWGQLRQMLTWAVRGERFSPGFWGSILEQGTVLALLERVRTLTENEGEPHPFDDLD